MITTKEYTERTACNCPECGQMLMNPGYNQQLRYCCGKSRQWYDVSDVTVVWDNGRDEHGRFHHRAKLVSRESVVRYKGGS